MSAPTQTDRDIVAYLQVLLGYCPDYHVLPTDTEIQERMGYSPLSKEVAFRLGNRAEDRGLIERLKSECGYSVRGWRFTEQGEKWFAAMQENIAMLPPPPPKRRPAPHPAMRGKMSVRERRARRVRARAPGREPDREQAQAGDLVGVLKAGQP